jgi:NAD(P)-dependent dehydrogenase (short-subunit alcohol dehydrogenase family)
VILRFTGRVVLVAGAAEGIGACIADRFGREGEGVAFTDTEAGFITDAASSWTAA